MSIINTYMRNYFKSLRGDRKGFTLIELLVVIGILGILAASLLITIDPFEQLKKGRDTTTKGAAIDYLNASTRYYATHGKLPWDASTTDTCVAPTTATALNTAGMQACTTLLIDDGELKKGYDTNIANSGVDAQILVIGVANSTDIAICFAPTSKSEKSAPQSKWSGACDGTTVGTFTGGTCPSGKAPDNSCYQQFK